MCINVYASTSDSNSYVFATNRNSNTNLYDDVNSDGNTYT
jgi:hypothetical protein